MAEISVIIPCYNAEEYIQATLQSLEKQTFLDFNVILVDDCSTDNTAQTIADYKATSGMEIVYIKNKKNLGPAGSRNRGISFSDAEYIGFCDSDDSYDSSYLEKMMDAANHNEADIVLCGHRKVFIDKRYSIERPLSCKSGELEKKEALLMEVDALWSMIVKRKIAERYPLPDLRNGEDMAVIPVWLMHGERIAANPAPLYNYLVRQDSLSNKPSMKIAESLEASFSNILRNIDERYVEQVEYLGIRNLLYGALLNLFKLGDKRKEATAILKRFEKVFPQWEKNINIVRLPLFKRVFVKAVAKRRFLTVFLMAQIHAFLLK